MADLKSKEKKLPLEITKHDVDRVKDAWQSDKKAAWAYRADDGLDFINAVTTEVNDDVAKEHGGVVVLASGEEHKSGPIVVFRNEDAVHGIVAKTKEAVGEVKGGGKGEKWQGKVMCWRWGEL
ncbi:hypothetical protein QQX98_007032 [Neonectria punicea]|uniref:Uncharacterized protein n=1 Tax=Neonectria punicea TaxID=979145 RepID=A0ABR1GZ00_9HYPO